ncbi:hypothetical protein [Nocardia sp. NPDC050793]|uniref:hypothetical protein n=1 Tax=Nocardia sp. NPDC050793 TaxID=3155159 RepID=UPI0033FAC07E
MSGPECLRCARPSADGAPLCTTCGGSLVDELRAVPALLAEAEVTRAGLAHMTAHQIGGRSADPQLPIRPARGRGAVLEGDRARAQLVNTITTWARLIAEELGVEIYIGGPHLVARTTELRGPLTADRTAAALPDAPPDATAQAAAWLAEQRHQLRAHPAAEQLHDDVRAAVAALRRYVDRPIERRYLGACPAVLDDRTVCQYELRAEIGDDGRTAPWVRCGRCRTQHEVARIEADARALAEQQLYTLADLVRVTAVIGAAIPKRTLYHWAHGARRLEPRGWQHLDDDGRVRITDHRLADCDPQVYRLGDALELARRPTR